MRCVHTATVFATALLASLVGIGATLAAAATCASLKNLMLPDTEITAAEAIPTVTPTAPYKAPDKEVFTNLPAFCRVAATLKPTSDSNIHIEVWLPSYTWNGRYLGTGNGGGGGSIVYGALAIYLRLNYAVANTDQGAFGVEANPLVGHPERQIDRVTRSTYLMTARSKEIIQAFYGSPAKYSYFAGCSSGGGQSVHEALQFPGDYDGIIAGAPFMNETHLAAGHIWNSLAFSGPALISLDQANAVTAAVVKQCVGKDGGPSSDNFLTDPRDCHWDPGALQCTGGPTDAPTCLTTPQVAALREFYQGPINPRTGERILAGRVRASENNPIYLAALPGLGASQGFPYWVFGLDFDWRTFDFDQNMDAVDDALAATVNANTADLEEFRSHGGKLILTHGFADPRLPTLNTIAYYERLITSQTREDRDDAGERTESLRRTQDFDSSCFPGCRIAAAAPGRVPLRATRCPPVRARVTIR
jgi:feruloyl esterase